MSRLCVLCLTSFLLFSLAAAHGQIISTPNADIEFIGLRKWSAQDLYDKIVAANPDKAFHACAVYLIDVLGFADASVNVSISQGRMYIIVIVVEPEYASRVRYNIPPKDFRPPIARWSKLVDIYGTNPNEYSFALQLAGYHYGNPYYDVSKSGLPFGDEEISIINQVWKVLEAMNTPEDRALALDILENDANYLNRIVAISVLGNFLGQDSAWHAIMKAFCDSDTRVSSSGTAILTGFAQSQKRIVDWSPAVATIRALLDGTNLFAFIPALRILTATGFSSKIATPLLQNGGDLLVDFLKANRQSDKDLAHSLLVKLAGQDFGYDSVKWSAWITSLR